VIELVGLGVEREEHRLARLEVDPDFVEQVRSLFQIPVDAIHQAR